MSYKRDSAAVSFQEEITGKRRHVEDDIEIDDSDEVEESDEESGEDEDEDDEADSLTVTLSETDLTKKKQEILAEYREFTSKLKNDRAKVAREGGLDHATELLTKINKLRDIAAQYKLSQDISLYDSRNLKEIGDLMDLGMRSIKLGTSEKALRPEEFIKKLKTHLLVDAMSEEYDDGEEEGGGRENFLGRHHQFNEFNWFSLGAFLYSRGSKPITTGHLLGPLEIEKKIRQVVKRSKNDFSGETKTAENVTSNEINSNSTNHTTNAVLECFRIFQKKAKGDKVNIFKFFINPDYFSQTIENMFYTSFLIRDGRLILEEDEEGYPTIRELPPLPTDPKLRDQEAARRLEKSSNHIIFELEYSSWQKLIKKFNITESFIPTRN